MDDTIENATYTNYMSNRGASYMNMPLKGGQQKESTKIPTPMEALVELKSHLE